MKVKDHKIFACFDYISKDSSKIKLGDVVKKVSEDGVEIGVIIQVQSEEDFRTDMFGNGHISEITMATLEDIKKHRDELIKHLSVSKKTDKVAKLVRVTLITRVVVDAKATREQIIEASKANFIDKIRDTSFGENIDSIRKDKEVPYDIVFDEL